MVLDHHVHTQFGDRLDVDAFDLAAGAEAAGIRVLGYAENFPLPPSFADRVNDETNMPVEDFEHYVDTVRGVRAEFSDRDLKVLIGTEVDWLPGYRMFIEHLLQRHTPHLDFATLSLHYVGDHPIDLSRPHLLEARREFGRPDGAVRSQRPTSDTIIRGLSPDSPDGQRAGSTVDDDGPAADALIRDYYEAILDGVSSGLFQIVAHLDLVKKFDRRSGDSLAERFETEIERILEAMAANGNMALELNTSGIDMFCHEPFPSLVIAQRALDFGIPLTLGSDASANNRAARHFNMARQILLSLGVSELAWYQKRERQLMDVSDWLAGTAQGVDAADAARDDTPAA